MYVYLHTFVKDYDSCALWRLQSFSLSVRPYCSNTCELYVSIKRMRGICSITGRSCRWYLWDRLLDTLCGCNSRHLACARQNQRQIHINFVVFGHILMLLLLLVLALASTTMIVLSMLLRCVLLLGGLGGVVCRTAKNVLDFVCGQTRQHGG